MFPHAFLGPYDDTEANPSPNESSPLSSSDSDMSFQSMLDSMYSATGGANTDDHRQPLLSDDAHVTPINSPMMRSVLTTHRPPSIDDGYESPVPQDEAAAEKRNEARYRGFLTHPYHASLNLPRKSHSCLYFVLITCVYGQSINLSSSVDAI